jgi:hypothetical protein
VPQADFVHPDFIVLRDSFLKQRFLAPVVISVKKEVLYQPNVNQELTKMKRNRANVNYVQVAITVTLTMICKISLPICVHVATIAPTEQDML